MRWMGLMNLETTLDGSRAVLDKVSVDVNYNVGLIHVPLNARRTSVPGSKFNSNPVLAQIVASIDNQQSHEGVE
ncbi:hypothetical protein MJO28_017048 [Puccinia striiformis f. sp. tritici]|nr:hypothetical protein MJO28_017048 [Puccinia striiformis f. sp. tritici]